MAGKAVFYSDKSLLDELIFYPSDKCTNKETIDNLITQNGYRIFRLDQYQADWTFEYGVPPNPLVVDANAPKFKIVNDSEGNKWDCDNGDRSHGQVVHEQGTFKFPYTTMTGAILRAEGTTPKGAKEPLRAGYGWTILIKPGIYSEKLQIDIPLTLKKDELLQGSVTNWLIL